MNYHQEEEIAGKAYDARLMRRLLKYLTPYKLYVIISIILLCCAIYKFISCNLLVRR